MPSMRHCSQKHKHKTISSSGNPGPDQLDTQTRHCCAQLVQFREAQDSCDTKKDVGGLCRLRVEGDKAESQKEKYLSWI